MNSDDCKYCSYRGNTQVCRDCYNTRLAQKVKTAELHENPRNILLMPEHEVDAKAVMGRG
jgi:hypothetical protein